MIPRYLGLLLCFDQETPGGRNCLCFAFKRAVKSNLLLTRTTACQSFIMFLWF